MQHSSLYTNVKQRESKELHYMKDGLTELTVICVMAGEWKEANCLTAVCWNQSQQAEITVVKRVITKRWNKH
jgi:hypothetical protein